MHELIANITSSFVTSSFELGDEQLDSKVREK